MMRYYRPPGSRYRPALLAFVLVLGFSAVGQTQDGRTQDGRTEDAFRPAEATAEVTTPTPLSISLPAVTDAEQAEWALRDTTGPLQIGFGRELPVAYQDDLAPLLEWVTRSDGTLVSAVKVTSPGAWALRVAVSAILGPDATLRFFNPADPAQHFEPVTQQDFTSQDSGSAEDLELPALPVWSPVIAGETVGMEISLPSSHALSTFSLYVDQVSHMVSHPVSHPVSSGPRYQQQRLVDIGRASCEHIDIQCADPPVDPQADATAKMIFTTEDGYTAACTGTLLKDGAGDSVIPYFLTAHHCIETQSVARTLVTYWDFERAECEGDDPTTLTQLTGGADLLATHPESDSSLLRLRRPPPPLDEEEREYVSWDETPLTHPTEVYGVHHPAADLKKYSAGLTVDFRDIYLGPDLQEVRTVEVRWSQGTAEPGSSGSGLFDAYGQLRGVLSGSPAGMECGASVVYGRFDRLFPLIRHHLDPDGDMDGNTREAATGVGAASSTPRSLEYGGDIDYFRVEVTQAGTLTVETTGNTDTVGQLRGADGQALGEDDDGGSGLNFRLVRQVTAGTYYIRVSGFENATGPYTLVVRFAGTGTSGEDHAGTLEQASSVALNSSTSGVLEDGRDIDYFRVEVTQAGTLTVETTGNTDTVGQLQGADGQRLSEDDDGGSGLNFRLARQVAAGTYYIRVSGFGDASGAYVLSVRFTPTQ